MKRVKGFGGGRKKLLKAAKQADTRAGWHAYRGRKNKKRNMRRMWQVRINAAARQNDMSYSQFMGNLKKNDIKLNRKMLAEIAADMPNVFSEIVEEVK